MDTIANAYCIMENKKKMKHTNPNAHTYSNEPRNQSYERRERVCKVWSGKWRVWSVKCGVWNVKCGVSSAKCKVWSVKCDV